jgi:L-ascorbate metabolism protein UlaG (beta-lactamase superfamily)
MDLTYFGHATFQIETGDNTLLFDPFFEDNPHTNVDPATLDPDFVLVSHAHFDHYAGVESFAGDGGPMMIGNFEIITRIGNDYGHENVHPLNEGGTLELDFGTVEAVHARHTSSFPDGSYGGVPEGFVMDFGDQTVYYTGDTAPFVEMEWIGEMYDVDVMIAPVGDVVTMGIDGAIHAAEMVEPDLVVPVHYNTFPFIEVDLEEVQDAFEDAGFDIRIIDFDDTVTL